MRSASVRLALVAPEFGPGQVGPGQVGPGQSAPSGNGPPGVSIVPVEGRDSDATMGCRGRVGRQVHLGPGGMGKTDECDRTPVLRTLDHDRFYGVHGRQAERLIRLQACRPPQTRRFPWTRGCVRCPMRVQERRARSRTSRSTLIWEIPVKSRPQRFFSWRKSLSVSTLPGCHPLSSTFAVFLEDSPAIPRSLCHQKMQSLPQCAAPKFRRTLICTHEFLETHASSRVLQNSNTHACERFSGRIRTK